MITKSGTNTLHGSGFYLQQPQALDRRLRLDRRIPRRPAGARPEQEAVRRLARRADREGQALLLRLLRRAEAERRRSRSTRVVLDPADLRQVAGPRRPGQLHPGPRRLGRLRPLDFQALGEPALPGSRSTTPTTTARTARTARANDTLQHNGIEGDEVAQPGRHLVLAVRRQLLNDFNFNYVHESVPRAGQGPRPARDPGRQPPATARSASCRSSRRPSATRSADTFTYLIAEPRHQGGGEYNDTSIDQIFKGNWRGVFVFNNNADLLAGKYFQYRQFGGLGGLTADQAGTRRLRAEGVRRFRPGPVVRQREAHGDGRRALGVPGQPEHPGPEPQQQPPQPDSTT